MDESDVSQHATSSSSVSSPTTDRSLFRHPNHTEKAFETLNALRKQGQLCDVLLVADDVQLSAHRVVLAACSHYFSAMFTSKLSESRAERILLQQIDGKTLSALIDFIYTSEIRITEDNVQMLLPAANILQLSEVRDACCEFLQLQLHPSNCIGIRAFADLHACTDLYSSAQIYTENHFSEVVNHDEFVNLQIPQVGKLISSDKLVVSSEEQVFEAVITWTMHDLENRRDVISQLIEHVRLPLLSQDYLIQRVEEEPLVKHNSRCKDFLIEAMKYHLLRAEQKPLYLTPRTKLRSPTGLPKMLLVIGGQAPKAIRSVECYDFKDEKWSHVADMPSRRCRCGVAVIGGLVYAVGGFNGSLRVRTVDVYEPLKDAWSSIASMEARRSTLGAAVLNGYIYAVGGFDGSSGLNSAEYYDPRTNEWHLVSSMSTRRSSVGVGVVAGLLYAVGGYDGASRHCLSSVECYCPANDTWTPVLDMSCRRSGAGIYIAPLQEYLLRSAPDPTTAKENSIVLDINSRNERVGVLEGILYAVGGHDGPLVRKSVECYNPETGQWVQIADMHLCRRNAGVVAYNGFLYVVGGDDGSSNLSSIEYYNPKADVWTILSSAMIMGRSYAGVCIIDKPI